MQRDPITQELIKNALATIADNMVVTVVRTARSQVVKQSMDFSTAICDARGQMVSQGLSIPIHLGAIMPALEGVLRVYGDDVQPGDVFINNDPYEGASHLPDIFLFKPVFARDVLLGVPLRHRSSHRHRRASRRGQRMRQYRDLPGRATDSAPQTRGWRHI